MRRVRRATPVHPVLRGKGEKPVLRVLLVPPVLREARGDQVLQASLGQRERPPNRLR